MIVRNLKALDAYQCSGKQAVIIGAGTIGLYLAKLLLEKGFHVTVVESGDTTLGSFSADGFRNVGKTHHGARIGRSRSVGGTSNLWGGQLVEFSPADFGGRPWLESSTWPIGTDELTPYFRRAFQRLGIEPAVQHDAPIWQERLGETPGFTNDIEIFLTRWMKTPSMAVMYADDIHANPTLAVLVGHTAIGFRAQDTRITGVLLRTPDGDTSHLEGDVVIIAAGTIEAVRLLLAAEIDRSWACPWRTNKMLGLRFQDHLGGRIGTLTPIDKRRIFRIFSTLYSNGHKFQPKLRVTESACLANRLLGAQGIMCFESSATEHLVFLKQFLKAAIQSRRLSGMGDFFRHAIACARHLPPLMWTYMKEHRMFVPFDSQVVLNVQAEQVPNDRSRITVDPSRRDSMGLPQAVIDWQVTGEELPTILDLAQRCGRALEAAGLATLAIEPDLLALKPSFLDTLHDTYHAAGGAIMGVDDRHGVVDRDLRVFGTTNLYVASAATFPTSSSANVTFTALAFATRLADHLQ
ncbi:MAG: FAD-dependent oxidoreductase [Planctomycetia bacterium]